MNGFDVGIYAIRRRAGRRRPFEVRWRGAGRVRLRSFPTRALVDSYSAEQVRTARTGLEFDLSVGSPPRDTCGHRSPSPGTSTRPATRP